MHIEVGVVEGAKMVLSYGTAAASGANPNRHGQR